MSKKYFGFKAFNIYNPSKPYYFYWKRDNDNVWYLLDSRKIINSQGNHYMRGQVWKSDGRWFIIIGRGAVFSLSRRYRRRKTAMKHLWKDCMALDRKPKDEY